MMVYDIISHLSLYSIIVQNTIGWDCMGRAGCIWGGLGLAEAGWGLLELAVPGWGWLALAGGADQLAS